MPANNSTTCVIGDIHGCHEALTHILDKVTRRADTIVFLGDYVDRGPHAKEVVTTVLTLCKTHPRVIALMGNHDWMFLQYLNDGNSDLFLQVGGRQTLASYGLSTAATPADRRQLVPSEHIAFFSSLPIYWEDQHALYVHAGLQPGRHLSQQSAQWCLWARESFLLATTNFGKPVVFGHTVFPEPFFAADKIGIDTGAVYGGHLTALLLPEREVISVPGLVPTPPHNVLS